MLSRPYRSIATNFTEELTWRQGNLSPDIGKNQVWPLPLCENRFPT
jgi:hypothetical protein